MKIMVISTELPPLIGGIGSYTQGLVSALEMLKHRVVVVTSVAQGSLLPKSESLVLRPVTEQKKYQKLLPLCAKAQHVIHALKPDLVIALTWPHEGLLARYLKFRYQIPYILCVHGSDLLRHQDKVTRHMMKHVLQQAALCVSNSQFTQRLLAPLTSSEVIYPYFNRPILNLSPHHLAAFKRQHQIRQGPVLLTVSRLTPRKGHARIIRLLPQLILQFPDLTYLYTGASNYASELEALAIQCGVQAHIRALGFVDDQTLSLLYRISDIYVSPAQADDEDVEGFGISFLEASAYGLPVIAGRSGGSVEAVQDQHTGLLVDASDEQLLGALCDLLSHPVKRNTLGQNGHQRVHNLFSLSSQALALERILSQFRN